MSLPPRRWFLYAVVALVFATGVWYFGFRTDPTQSQRRGGFSFRSRGGTTPIPVRAVPARHQELSVHLRAIGTVIHSGRQLATAEARIVGPDGRVYAHGTTTCLVFETSSS